MKLIGGRSMKASKVLAEYKIRASAAHNLTAGQESITAKQLIEIDELESRQLKVVAGEAKPLTHTMQARLAALIEKRDKPDELPQGAISFLVGEYYRILHGIEPFVHSKEIEKGRACEADSLELYRQLYRQEWKEERAFEKNTQRRSNGYLQGEIDCIEGLAIIDAKTSWNQNTFTGASLTEANYWQAQSYLSLWPEARYCVMAYCLVDTPEHQIYDAFRRACWLEGVQEDSEYAVKQLEPYIRRSMTFEDRIPAKNRLKTFIVEPNADDLDHLISRVKMAREWLLGYHISKIKYKPQIPNVVGLYKNEQA